MSVAFRDGDGLYSEFGAVVSISDSTSQKPCMPNSHLIRFASSAGKASSSTNLCVAMIRNNGAEGLSKGISRIFHQQAIFVCRVASGGAGKIQGMTGSPTIEIVIHE